MLHDNPGHSCAPAMFHVHGMGAHFLSPSLCSHIMGEEPQRNCYLVLLCDFLPNPLSSSAQNEHVRSLHGDVLPGLAHPQHPSEAMLCLGLGYTQFRKDQSCRACCTCCHILGHWNAGPTLVLTLPLVAVRRLPCTSQPHKCRCWVPALLAFLFKQFCFSHLSQ